MAWPCPHWPQTVFFGGDAGEEQCSWGPPDSRARSPTGRSQGSGKRHGDVEEYPSADRDRFFIGKKAPFLHYFLGPSDVRWQTLPTLKREDPQFQRPVTQGVTLTIEPVHTTAEVFDQQHVRVMDCVDVAAGFFQVLGHHVCGRF